jgi:hypothetical protein
LQATWIEVTLTAKDRIFSVAGFEMPKIFISYARVDSEFAEKLVTDLRSAGVDLWFDQHDILPGDRWDSAVETALMTSPWLMVVLTPESVASQNVMDEVAEALKLGKRIVPVLHRQCDIPFRIGRLQYVDFTGSYERGIKQLMAIVSAPQPAPTGPTSAPPTYFLSEAGPGKSSVGAGRSKPVLIAASCAAVVLAAGIWGGLKLFHRPDPGPPEVLSVSGPPSWCKGTLSTAERAVCDTSTLWLLDAQLNQKYEAATARVGLDREKLSNLNSTEGMWRKNQREVCASDVTCLEGAYRSRITALSGIK